MVKRPSCIQSSESTEDDAQANTSRRRPRKLAVRRCIKCKWTPEEHKLLVAAIKKLGNKGQWAEIAQAIPGRTGKQCRERWANQLVDGMVTGQWTRDEEFQLALSHTVVGTSWKRMACRLPGRADNAIKNLWNSTRRSKASDVVRHKVLATYLQELATGRTPEEAFKSAACSLAASGDLPPNSAARLPPGRLAAPSSEWRALFDGERNALGQGGVAAATARPAPSPQRALQQPMLPQCRPPHGPTSPATPHLGSGESLVALLQGTSGGGTHHAPGCRCGSCQSPALAASGYRHSSLCGAGGHLAAGSQTPMGPRGSSDANLGQVYMLPAAPAPCLSPFSAADPQSLGLAPANLPTINTSVHSSSMPGGTPSGLCLPHTAPQQAHLPSSHPSHQHSTCSCELDGLLPSELALWDVAPCAPPAPDPTGAGAAATAGAAPSDESMCGSLLGDLFGGNPAAIIDELIHEDDFFKRLAADLSASAHTGSSFTSPSGGSAACPSGMMAPAQQRQQQQQQQTHAILMEGMHGVECSIPGSVFAMCQGCAPTTPLICDLGVMGGDPAGMLGV